MIVGEVWERAEMGKENVRRAVRGKAGEALEKKKGLSCQRNSTRAGQRTGDDRSATVFVLVARKLFLGFVFFRRQLKGAKENNNNTE